MAKRRSSPVEVTDYGPYRILDIHSDQIAECMKLYAVEKVDGISISPHHGYRLKDLSFLKNYPFVKGLAVGYAHSIDVSAISELQRLKFIGLFGSKQPIDFSVFRELEEIRVEWHPKMVFPKRSTRMKRLYMSGYKPKSKDFHELPDYPNLQELEIIQSPVHSLAGLERFKKLKRLELSYLTKLESIADLKSASLQFLHLDTCKKISDHAHVKNLRNLRILRFGNCGSMPSLDFLKQMPKLEELTFVDTNVEDGDLSACLRLERVGFLNKKHYSHTDDEVDAIIAARQKKRK